MIEQLITFETAKLAKEKGFDWKVLKAYDGVPMICSYSKSIFKPLNYNSPTGGNYCSAPTQSELQKWIEETHDIYIDVDTMTDVNRIVGFNIFVKSYKFFPKLLSNFSDKYEGIEKGIQLALKSIE